ncbi:hypothetical protein GO730_31930 [Spirosoma sp. HMF3257]|uniref:Uncharacterized protein n=1 Tax=Spirosoma telluris TaxID=2183553 RepID=A0A327NQA1_9BACT|nr:hypothetical protein [Spirosoma telluris]RAI77601.1 hypothetical protein HMF3257_31825 [Spirosoma telluris]
MEHNMQMLISEHKVLRARIKDLIKQLYLENVKNYEGQNKAELALLDEWEYEGQEFNAITEQGLAHITNEKLDELFTWDDLETESLLEVVHILEDKEFVEP